MEWEERFTRLPNCVDSIADVEKSADMTRRANLRLFGDSGAGVDTEAGDGVLVPECGCPGQQTAFGKGTIGRRYDRRKQSSSASKADAAWRRKAWSYSSPNMAGVLRDVLLISIFLVTVLTAMAVASDERSVIAPEFRIPSGYPEKVCGNIEITRSKMNELWEYENCTVVEGHVQVTYITADADQIAKIRFPKLREITDFLVVYRVERVESMKNMFPNLAVIRGQNLFSNYALVVYEMQHLLELGLVNLSYIERGAVRIEKNPLLCYVDTISWSHLAPKSKADNFFKENNNEPCRGTCQDAGCTAFEGKPHCWNEDTCQRICQLCGSSGCVITDNSTCCHEECLGGCWGPSASECMACRNVFHDGVCRNECPRGYLKYMNRRCLSEEVCMSNATRVHDSITGKVDFPLFKKFKDSCVEHCPPGYTHKCTGETRECEKCEAGQCPVLCGSKLVDSIQAAQELKGCTRITGYLNIEIRSHSTNIITELENNLNSIEEIDGYLTVVRSTSLLSLNFLKNLRIIRGNKKDGEFALKVLDNLNLRKLWDLDKTSLKINGKASFNFNPKLCYKSILELVERKVIKPGDLVASNTTNGDQIICNIRKINVTEITKVADDSLVLIVKWENIRKDLPDHRSLLNYVLSYREARTNVSIYDGRDACTDPWKYLDVPVGNEKSDIVHQLITGLKPATRYAIYIRTYTIQSPAGSQGGISDVQYVTTMPTTPSDPRDVRVWSDEHDRFTVSWVKPLHENGVVGRYKVEIREHEQTFPRHRCTKSDLDTIGVMPPASEFAKAKLAKEKEKALQEERDRKRVPDDDEEEKVNLWTKQGCCPCENRPDLEETIRNSAEEAVLFEDKLMSHVFSGRRPATGNIECHKDLDKCVNTCRVDAPNNRKKRELEATFHDDLDTMISPELTNQITGHYGSLVTVPSSYDDSVMGSILDNNVPVSSDINARGDSGYSETPQNVSLPQIFWTNETTLEIIGLKHFTQYDVNVEACHVPTEEFNSTACSRRGGVSSGRTKKKEDADKMVTFTVHTVGGGNSSLPSGDVCAYWKSPKEPNGAVIGYGLEYRRHDVENIQSEEICIQLQDLLTGCSRSERSAPANASSEPELFPPETDHYYVLTLNPGTYSFTLKAISAAGVGPEIVVKDVVIEANDDKYLELVLPICIALFLVLGLMAFIGVWYARRRARLLLEKRLTWNPNYALVLNEDYVNQRLKKEFQLDRSKITQGDYLGGGAFGIVHQGTMELENGELIGVAIKTTQDCQEMTYKEFFDEITRMQDLQCHHIVKLLGVVNQGQVLAVLELMECGDLKHWLESKRNSSDYGPLMKRFDFTFVKEIYRMAAEICDGMAYLAHHNIVHRDLAARNCLVASDLTVKIGDLGFAREVDENYYRKLTPERAPMRWMAPESHEEYVYFTQSDVWSFGVVLWEMATGGLVPYASLKTEQISEFVIGGGTLKPPEGCPKFLADVMTRCWARQPQTRPSFKGLVHVFAEFTRPNFREVSFALTELHPDADDSALIDVTTPLVSEAERRSNAGDDLELRGAAGGSKSHATRLKNFVMRKLTIERPLGDVDSDGEDTAEDRRKNKRKMKAGFGLLFNRRLARLGGLTNKEDAASIPLKPFVMAPTATVEIADDIFDNGHPPSTPGAGAAVALEQVTTGLPEDPMPPPSPPISTPAPTTTTITMTQAVPTRRFPPLDIGNHEAPNDATASTSFARRGSNNNNNNVSNHNSSSPRSPDSAMNGHVAMITLSDV